MGLSDWFELPLLRTPGSASITTGMGPNDCTNRRSPHAMLVTGTGNHQVSVCLLV